MSSRKNNEPQQIGCVSIVVTVLFLWALIFGVTIDGKHRQIGCSCDKGVEVSP